ncbi:MAG: zinc ribbon domain-containing protein [Planctomycetota bacterium]
MPFADAQTEIPYDLFCQECGYNLRGLTSDRCPECGYSLKTLRSQVPRIPWVFREELGRLRAYWRTVWMVMFRHKRFCEEVARPVDYGDAQRFRWVTVLHVYLPVLAGTVLLHVLPWPSPFDGPWLDEPFRGVWPMAGFHLCILLFLAAATGVPSYFFHPRDIPIEQQNRAVALSYYACAALGWTPLAFVIGLAGLSVLYIQDRLWGRSAEVLPIVGGVLVMLGALLPIGQIVGYIGDLIHIGVRVMPQRKGQLALLGFALPLLWLGLAGLIFVGLPAIVFYVVLIVTSLL